VAGKFGSVGPALAADTGATLAASVVAAEASTLLVTVTITSSQVLYGVGAGVTLSQDGPTLYHGLFGP